MSNDKVQQKPELTEQEKAQEFNRRYTELCQEFGYKIVGSPAWASTNHGSFEMVIQYNIVKLPQEQSMLS